MDDFTDSDRPCTHDIVAMTRSIAYQAVHAFHIIHAFPSLQSVGYMDTGQVCVKKALIVKKG